MAFLGRAFSMVARLGVPQVRRAAQGSSTPVSRTLYPALQEAQGNVVYESDAPVAAISHDRNEAPLPESIEMLTTNNVAVQPSLLLEAFPWHSLLERPPQRVVTAEGAPNDIARLYADLQRWEKLGHLVNPRQAVDICKRFATWMSLRDIEGVLQPQQSEHLDAVKKVLANDLDVSKFSQRHQQILTLLAEDRVHEAYLRAQSALQSLESVQYIIESARMRVLEAQRRVSMIQWRSWAAAGAFVVLGVACEYIAYLPEVNLPIIESALTSAALSGAVVCLSAATALHLSSDQFSSYLGQIRDANDARLRVRLKLQEDINTCLEQGYLPNA